MSSSWTDLSPRAVPNGHARKHVVAFAEALVAYVRDSAGRIDEADVEARRKSFVRSLRGLSAQECIVAEAYGSILADLAKQGWTMRSGNGAVEAQRPPDESEGLRESRRRQLAARRNEQLREPATREFVFRMERGHIFNGARVSIFSLMRDGRALATALQAHKTGTPPADREELPIQPYLQVVERPCLCEFTGFELTDIWRYFRHTWSTANESIPGRTMALLIRDAAAPFHPVIGISALSSAASVLPVRDSKFIRWSAETFIADAQSADNARKRKLARWLRECVDDAISEIYRQDFIEDGILPGRLPNQVSAQLIKTLRDVGKDAKDQHFADTRDAELVHKKGHGKLGDAFWLSAARKPLFRAKRALELADLLLSRNEFDAAKDRRSPSKTLDNLLATSRGRKTIGKVVRRARAQSIGSAIADLTVCGAVAPYNEIIGGKLVALLSISPFVVEAYKKRYGRSASVIGSSMAGKRVVRHPNLVFVGTTSLYGIRPNQYDRALVPRGVLGGAGEGSIGFRFLGNTEGYGTSQFSEATKQALERLTKMKGNGRSVNNVFGEGANARLRALRDGLDLMGLPEELLVHGLEKSVYGVTLVEQSTLRDYLLGITRTPRYLFPKQDVAAATSSIAKYWFTRWVIARLERPETDERLREHALVHPIRHGARLRLPEADIDQISLFGADKR